MSKDIYTKTMDYEMFIRSAFNCPRGMKNGADQCFMRNAMSMEKGETFAKHLGSFQKQFDKVKDYMSKALIKLSKTNDKKFFLELNSQLDSKVSTSELMIVIENGLNKIIQNRKNKTL